LRASRPNEVWSWDFVYDQTANGQGMRIEIRKSHDMNLVINNYLWLTECFLDNFLLYGINTLKTKRKKIDSAKVD
jgi:hypothetical protein